jgi:hypothetical protein
MTNTHTGCSTYLAPVSGQHGASTCLKGLKNITNKASIKITQLE